MDATDTRARLLALYPVLAELPPALREAGLGADAHGFALPDGRLLFEQGAPCQGFPLLLEGEVRVARGTPGGRTLELYRIAPGELCIASTSCLFGRAPLIAHATTVGDCRLLLLSPAAFERWLAFEPFRRYVFGIFAERIAELMALAEAVAFQRLDQRLAATLLGHGAVVLGTQQALADELGTVREIVTRLLKRFERQGWVRIGRERVEIVDAAALRAQAAGAGGLGG
ncbi:MAG: Crp/Fnr family transcriptional regulator [Burkholderiales bacterium]|nr:Crp/Fnr family transcriptional regulator [Burkholderiales bacterium]MDE2504832.1 Crp/Fnr family transcriptional regulator [Burkholderiales bacterium]